MDVSVNLGQTKSAEGIKLISQSFVSALGEQVILLLQLHATPQEAKMIEKECSLI
ncbi:hypothetical protein HN682_00110, partial [Candidatus Peregrinibacteria bacterium]|nr:hypothetical protein [Candidatus Peregrinibacteria bacterium]